MKKKVWDITVKDNPNRVIMGENDEFYTTDTEAFLVFNLQDKDFQPQSAMLTLENRNDGSLKSEEVSVVGDNIAWEMPERYIEHSGNWQAQLVYEQMKGGVPEKYTSGVMAFTVNSHIKDKKKPSLVEIENWEKFIRDGTELIETWEDMEELRQANYQELLDTGVLQTNINTKLEQLEEEYAPKLTEVTTQLTQKVGLGKKAELEDLSPAVLSAIEGGEGTSFNLESIPRNYSVSHEKTTFAERVVLSDNLINPSDITNGYTINKDSGELFLDSRYNISGFTSVEKDSTYALTYATDVYKFDLDQNYIGFETASSFTPSADMLVRIRIVDSSIYPFRLNKGTLKSWDEYREATKIKNLLLNEEEVKDIVFPNDELPDNVEIKQDRLSFIYHDSPNLFNKDTVTLDKRLSIGDSMMDGVTNSVSDYIDVLPDTTYSVTEGSYTHFYDENKNYITGHGTGIVTFQTTEETAFIRITVRKVKLDKFMLIVGSVPPLEQDYIPYDQWAFTENIQVLREAKKSKHEGKRFGFLGDSIVENEPYFFAEIKKTLGLSDLIDYGIGGTSYAERGNLDWDDKNLVKRVSTMDSTLDGAFVLCGTNDFSNAIPLGDFEDRTESTFYGALHLTFSALLSKYPLGNLYVLTMPPRYNQTTKIGGVYVHDFVRAMKEVGAHYSIPVHDILSNSQARPWIQSNKELYYKSADGLHPNNLLYDLILDSFIPFANAY